MISAPSLLCPTVSFQRLFGHQEMLLMTPRCVVTMFLNVMLWRLCWACCMISHCLLCKRQHGQFAISGKTPDVFEALKDLTGHHLNIVFVADANVLSRLLELVTYQSHSVIYVALRTAGHLIRHEPKGQNDVSVQTKNIIDNQGLPFIRNLLINNDCLKETCWIISEVTTRNSHRSARPTS